MRILRSIALVLALFAASSAVAAPASAAVRARKTPIESSCVFEAYRYSPGSQTLTLWFYNGAVYRYERVSESTVQEFLRAPNKGRYFHQHIRTSHAYARVLPPKSPATQVAITTP